MWDFTVYDEVHADSLSFPLNFSVNLKLLKKIKPNNCLNELRKWGAVSLL